MVHFQRLKNRWRIAAFAVLFCTAVPAQAQPVLARLLFPALGMQEMFRSSDIPFHTELSKLRANRIGPDVLLEWITLSEVGNRGFEVQRASSDSRGWKQAGFIPGGGDGSFARTYSFRDRRVPPEDLRYMLRIIGDDGMIQYSQIISVPVSGTLRAFVVRTEEDDPRTAPNVTVDLLNDDVISLQLTDHRGNIIENIVSKREISSGKHEFAVDCSRLPSGQYEFLLFTSEGRYNRAYDHRR
ncbi:MAG: hypothetical protein IH600_08275 [Bacteroidetes bacterium]|nr:hypothetical protein [Bacteroidota bacterium]